MIFSESYKNANKENLNLNKKMRKCKNDKITRNNDTQRIQYYDNNNN